MEEGARTSSPDGYEDLGRALIRIYREKRSPGIGPVDMARLLDWVRTQWRHVDLTRDKSASGLPACLHPQFLEVARAGAQSVAARTLDGETQRKPGVSSRTEAAVLAARDGHTRALCPFTATVKRVAHTLGPLWSLIEEGDEVCLAGALGAPMTDVNLETTWVFPAHRLILQVNMLYAEHFAPQSAAELFERTLRMQDDVVAYLNRPPAQDGVSLFEFTSPHIAHNLWNLQTGWFNTFERAAPSRFRSLVTLRGQNFFGTLEELYPERMQGAPPVVEVEHEDEAFRYALKRGGLAMTVKDELIQPGLISAVRARARAKSSPEFLAELAQLRAASHPLLVFSLRLENRSWIEQREGLPPFLAALQADFPGLAIVLDGLSSDTDKGWTTQWMSLSAELDLAKAVRAAAPPGLRILSVVGRPFAEAITACAAADAFVAPIGAAQTVSKWIGGLRGLAFSNSNVLRGVNFEAHWTALNSNFEERYMPGIAPTRFLPTRDVIDGPAVHGDPQRANFHMDWRTLHREAKAMLEAFGIARPAAS
jgi:hypothetical protein